MKDQNNKTNNYFYIISDKISLLNNEPFEELIRERNTNLQKFNKSINFWLSESDSINNSISFLKNIKDSQFYKNFKSFSKITHKNSKNQEFVHIITNDIVFMDWICNRIPKFENLDNQNQNNKIKNFIGIFGKIKEKNDILKIIRSI